MTCKLPEWIPIKNPTLSEKKELHCANKKYYQKNNVWKYVDDMHLSESQSTTSNVFGFKWHKEETYNSASSLKRIHSWLIEKYGDINTIIDTLPKNPLVLDAGCGAATSALELFADVFDKIHYIGVDISDAVDVAARKVKEKNYDGFFMQEDITKLPFEENSIDCIFSEGVLHHTDSTKGALEALAPLLKKHGVFLFYVYRKKTPIREFSDDFIRERLQGMSPEKAWEMMAPLTELGSALGQIDAEIDLPSGIPVLDIPAGKLSLQRFFYWHICKTFYHEELTFEEMQHINFDWFAPKNAFRQTPEEVKQWCANLGLIIERFHTEEAGISVIARKK